MIPASKLLNQAYFPGITCSLTLPALTLAFVSY